jgi:DUF4097 and DUF4098 domain-containing protein YvlB
MLTSLFSLVLATSTVMHTDTTISVSQGARLAVHNFGGDIIVRPWPKSAIRVEAEHGPRTIIVVDQEGSSFEIKAQGWRRAPIPVDLQITAPSWVALDLQSVNSDISVDGWTSDVVAETVNGDVEVKGGKGLVRLQSIVGGVRLQGGEGRIQLSSVEDDVTVSDCNGEISAEAVSGSVVLERVRSRIIEAATVDGDIDFTGPMESGGRYRFSTHSGDMDIVLPESSDATVTVSTFNGGFETGFPVRVNEGGPGKSFTFTLGSGKALLELETFTGTINLRHDGDEQKSKHGKPSKRDKEKDEK